MTVENRELMSHQELDPPAEKGIEDRIAKA